MSGFNSIPVKNPEIRKARHRIHANFAIQSKMERKRNPALQYVLPSQEQEKKTGRLEKLSANGDNTWVSIMTILSPELLCFSPLDKLQLSDCIPIAEISDICAFDDSSDDAKLSSESGPAWSRKFNNLQRLTSGKDVPRFPFVIYTIDKGYNANRSYFLRTESEEERTAWIEAIGELVSVAYNSTLTSRSKFRRLRYIGRRVYQHDITLKLTSLFIFGNFLQSCADAQLQAPDGSYSQHVFQVFEILFTAVFAFELAVNMFLHWFW
jgi:hypothetical protein